MGVRSPLQSELLNEFSYLSKNPAIENRGACAVKLVYKGGFMLRWESPLLAKNTQRPRPRLRGAPLITNSCLGGCKSAPSLAYGVLYVVSCCSAIASCVAFGGLP